MNDVHPNWKWEILYGGLQTGSTNIPACRQDRKGSTYVSGIQLSSGTVYDVVLSNWKWQLQDGGL